jgi:hypothetical protein
MTRRLVRTSPIPKSADDFFEEKHSPPVVTSRVTGSVINVKTFCGVTLSCRIIGVRSVTSGVVYDVRPASDPMVREFQKAGVPVNPDNAREKFVVFVWQILN